MNSTSAAKYFLWKRIPQKNCAADCAINCAIIIPRLSIIKTLNRKRTKILWKAFAAEPNYNNISLEVFSILGYLIAVCKLLTRNLNAFHIGRQKRVGSANHFLCN